MARRLQSLAIFASLVALLGMYLSHVPNSEGVPQMNRIRLLNAAMKITKFVVSISSCLQTHQYMFDCIL